MARKTLPVETKLHVLHEAGYKCANPVCRTILTLDIHHVIAVSGGGGNTPDNLLALCPNCHALHHKGVIPEDSIRAWKMLLLAVNNAFDRRSVDLLLMLDVTGMVYVSGEGVLDCASLIAAGLVSKGQYNVAGLIPSYSVSLSERGTEFVAAWKRGDQSSAVGLLPKS